MSFTRIGGIPSATTEDGEEDSKRVSIVLLFTRREGREGVVGVRSGSTGRRGHEVMDEPVIGEGEA